MLLSIAISSLVDEFDLATSPIGVVSFVSLLASMLLTVLDQAFYTCKVVLTRITDPGQIDKAGVLRGKRIHHHASTKVLAIAKHH